MNKKIVILGIIILLITVGLSGCNEQKNKGNVDEELYDVDISISTDKTEYAVDEEVNITLTIKNNMDKYFPFGDYSLHLFSVNKKEYGSSGLMSTDSISKLFVDSINVSPGDTFMEIILWEPMNRNLEPGDYYILFEIRSSIGGNAYAIEEKVSKEITFT